MERERTFDAVLRAVRRVNLQGSLFGQTVAIRLGLSESDIEALETLLDSGTATAGRLAELMGLTTGAVTRLIDRLEQSGYVRRVADPADRRRVVVELVPEKSKALEAVIGRVGRATAREIGRYSPEQLELIGEFLDRMAEATREETTRLREGLAEASDEPAPEGEHAAPLGGLTSARLVFRAGANEVTLRADARIEELYRAHFEGAVPQVRLRDGTVSVHYKGLPFDWRKRQADITLNATIPWALELSGGASRLSGDLTVLSLRSIELTGGASRLDLSLGRPQGAVPIRLTGGASEVRLRRPAGAKVLVRIIGGVGKIELDGQRIAATSGETVLESAGPADAADRYQVELTGGAGKITVGETR